MRVIVVGGGYAGLATIIELRRRMAKSEIHLVDPGSHHLKRTCLQKTLHTPLSNQLIPFAELGKRFGFTHHRARMAFDGPKLQIWQDRQSVPLPNGPLDFDYLVLATGAKPSHASNPDQGIYGLDEFCRGDGPSILTDLVTRPTQQIKHISVVGAGATGLQFLFELHHQLKKSSANCRLRLIDHAPTVLPHLPGRFHRYISNRLQAADISYLPSTQYLGQTKERIHIRALQSNRDKSLPSLKTLFFPGVVAYPQQIQTDRYGRIRVGDRVLWNLFAVGDCSHYDAPGMNALTAQAAIHKGKHIALNIQRIVQGRLPRIYTYNERGYFISLGPSDGVGWLGLKHNIITGLSACIAKETVETQYAWFLEGIDTMI
ncbi:MAG: FAD-dependent oxidoreductase [Candidatus Competibacteraceae bacterium]|nr:FAD-dependent oxidoreductase [Candidatus Competibacteraceae bacterium]